MGAQLVILAAGTPFAARSLGLESAPFAWTAPALAVPAALGPSRIVASGADREQSNLASNDKRGENRRLRPLTPRYGDEILALRHVKHDLTTAECRRRARGAGLAVV